MSIARDVRLFLLVARKNVEDAQALVEQNPTPDDVREAVGRAQSETMRAESLVATWAES